MPKLTPSENGFPKPKQVNCFQCDKEFYVKFVIPQQDYSKKNSWEYWTGEKQGVYSEFSQKRDKKICNDCLKNLYYDKPVYWNTIKDLRKRNLLRNYIYEGNV